MIHPFWINGLKYHIAALSFKIIFRLWFRQRTNLSFLSFKAVRGVQRHFLQGAKPCGTSYFDWFPLVAYNACIFGLTSHTFLVKYYICCMPYIWKVSECFFLRSRCFQLHIPSLLVTIHKRYGCSYYVLKCQTFYPESSSHLIKLTSFLGTASIMKTICFCFQDDWKPLPM